MLTKDKQDLNKKQISLNHENIKNIQKLKYKIRNIMISNELENIKHEYEIK